MSFNKCLVDSFSTNVFMYRFPPLNKNLRKFSIPLEDATLEFKKQLGGKLSLIVLMISLEKFGVGTFHRRTIYRS